MGQRSQRLRQGGAALIFAKKRQKGQQIGSVKVTLDGKVIATTPLVALEAVEQGGFFKRLWDEIRMWWASL